MWVIKDKTGANIRCVAKEIEYNGTWMGECYVTVTIESPVPVNFAIGDYLEYRGERFEINYDPTEIKSARKGTKGDAFKYEQVKFNSLSDELTRCDFLDYVKEDNQIHYTGLPSFSFFAATIQDLADRIQANLDRLYTGENRWTVKVQPEYVNKTDVNISVESKTKIWDALAYVNKYFGAYFIVRGRTITIGTAGIPTENLFRYGKGKGLATIKKQAESDQQIITRLRVYGSSDNLPTRYYNKKADASGKPFLPNNMAVNFLMLPGFPEETQDPYIDSPNIETLGVREGSVFFDGSDSELEEIKPSIEGMTAEQLKLAGIAVGSTGALDEIVGAEQTTDDGLWEELKEGEEIPPFTITIKDVGFDINDHLTTEEPVISFKSGMLGGRDFTIVKCEKVGNGYQLTCQRVYDDGLRLYFPYNLYNAKAGDRFVLLHIEMPDIYVKAASQRLLEAGQQYLEKNDYSRLSYSPEIDEHYMARQHVEAMASGGLVKSLHDTIKEGDVMIFDDEDLLIDNAAIIIDNLQIKEGDETIPKYTVTLRNEKTVGTIQRLQNQIDSIVSGGGQGAGGYNATQIRQMVFAYGKERFLSKLEPDVAQKVIKFLEGAQFGEYVKGFAGAGIDQHGNAEFESIESRSYLKVMELIYNRLNALEGNTSFADVGTIESIEQLSASKAKAIIRRRWEGDFTAFQHGDIVYGYVNDLDASGVYYKTWAWIDEIDREENSITLNYYVDGMVPAGKNFPMTANMIITRWGNNLTADATTHRNYPSVVALKNGKYINTRQSSFYISCEDGNIVQLLGVDRPILQPGNYGTVLGQIPAGLLTPEIEAMLNPQQPYLYARGIVVQDLIRIGYEGLQMQMLNYRGEWKLEIAKSENNYYRNEYGVCDIVTHNEYLWQCVVSKNTDEPSAETGSWINISGQRTIPSLSIYQIVPSANVIQVREKSTQPDKLTCVVERKSTEGDKTYNSNFDLLEDNLKLFYSLDGMSWKEFIFGDDEPLELEDESDVIELETSTPENKLTISMGGDEISSSQFGDSVYFQLRYADTDKVETTLIVPVVKDGKTGDWTSYVFKQSQEKPDTPTDLTSPIPTGWQDAPVGDGRWWMSKAKIDGTTQRPTSNGWSDPVQCTAEDGAPGPYTDFMYCIAAENIAGLVLTEKQKTARKPSGWSDTPPRVEIGYNLWMITAEIDANDNVIGEWSAPVKISGEKGEQGEPGEPGADGTHIEYRYYLTDYGREVHLTIYEKQNRTCGGAWYTTPKSSPTVNQALWMSMATIDANDNLVGEWADAVQISGHRGAVGEMGQRGLMAYPAGEYDKYTKYETTDTTTPVVLDTEVNAYYVLKAGKVWTNGSSERKSTPHEDYAMGGDEAKWQLMDKFNSIFANIIMAQFAKLGGAVFYGDYMFSQQGKLNGADSTNYEKFDPVQFEAQKKNGYATTFIPNLSLNLLTGEYYGLKAVLAGGEIGGFKINPTSIGYGETEAYDGLYMGGSFIKYSSYNDASGNPITNGLKRFSAIGVNTMPATGQSAVARFTSEAVGTSTLYPNLAMVLQAVGGSVNYALVAKGNIITDSLIKSYKIKTYSLTAERTVVRGMTYESDKVIVTNTASDAGIAMPTASQIREQLGLGSTSPFAVELTFIASHTTTKQFSVYGRYSGLSTINTTDYPVFYNNNGVDRGYFPMDKGDSLSVLLIHDGANYYAYTINYQNS